MALAVPGRTGSRLRKVRYRVRPYRRAVQVGALALLILAPFLNWFRVDLASASFYLFGQRFFARHFFYVGLVAMAGIYLIVAASVLLGRVFCGWICPQNLFNERGRVWDRRLGRPATVLLSWGISTGGAFVLVSYFVAPAELWRRLTAPPVAWPLWLAILAIGGFFTFAMAWWRTGICRMACPYGHLQSILTTPATLHLRLFQTGRDICATCGLCAETCHMGVDPRTLEQKHCVVCGDCLSACELVSGARKVPRVLNFVIGPEHRPVGFTGALGRNLRGMLPRLLIPLGAGLALTLVAAAGVAVRPRIHVGLWKDYQQGAGGSALAIQVVNLGEEPETFRIYPEGLPPGWAVLEAERLTLGPGEQGRVLLRILPADGSGPSSGHPSGDGSGRGYPFTVTVVGERTGVRQSVPYIYHPGLPAAEEGIFHAQEK